MNQVRQNQAEASASAFLVHRKETRIIKCNSPVDCCSPGKGPGDTIRNESCCGARCAPCPRWGCVAFAARLGCPISSLPINRLRHLSTPAHTYAPLHLPLAARSNVAAATRSGRCICHRQRSHRSPFRCTPSCGRQQSLSQPARLTAPFTQGSLWCNRYPCTLVLPSAWRYKKDEPPTPAFSFAEMLIFSWENDKISIQTGGGIL